MTNEIAIRYCDEYLARNISDIDKEFLKKAKEALQQEPCDDAVSREAVFEQIGGWIASGEYEFTNATDYLSKRIKAIPPVSSSENPNKCDDAISRQAVLEYIEGNEADLWHRSENELVCQYIKELPPVTPQQKDNIKGFCEIAGNLTNGDVIKTIFPNIDDCFSNVIDLNLWWKSTYKGVKE